MFSLAISKHFTNLLSKEQIQIYLSNINKSNELKAAETDKRIEDWKYMNEYFMKTIKTIDKQVSSLRQQYNIGNYTCWNRL